jgi:hypothetical protein
VPGKLKSTGDGGGAGVSFASEEREVRLEDALNAALTSWPSVEFVKMERRWRGLKAEAADAGILMLLCGVCCSWEFVAVVESVLGTWSTMSLGGINRLLELVESARSSRLNSCNGNRKDCTGRSY